MRLDFVFVLVAFGAIVCATSTYASPISSDIQQESDDERIRKSLQEDLDRLGMIATSQDGDNTMHSVGQSAGRIVKGTYGHIQKGLKFGRKLKIGGKKFGRKLKGGGKKFGQKVKGGGRKFGRRVRGGGRRFGQRVRGGGRRFGQRVRGGGRRFGQIIRGGGRNFGRALKGAGNFINNHRRGITKGLGRFTGEVIGTLRGRDTSGYYPGAAPVDYPAPPPRDLPGPPPSSQYPEGGPGNPEKAPGYPDNALGYPDTAPGPGYPDGTPGDPDTAPINPDVAPQSPSDSPSCNNNGQSQPVGPGGGGGEAESPSKEDSEMVLAELLESAEEQAAPLLQHDSFTVRKQNKFRYRRRGTVYKIKRFFKDLYQALNL